MPGRPGWPDKGVYAADQGVAPKGRKQARNWRGAILVSGGTTREIMLSTAARTGPGPGVRDIAVRGPLSAGLVQVLSGDPGGSDRQSGHDGRSGAGDSGPDRGVVDLRADPLADEDLQLALYLCYELHYRGLSGVDERWEWDPGLLAFRARLEATFEAALRSAVPPASGTPSATAGPAGSAAGPADAVAELEALAHGGSGSSVSLPSLSSYMAERGSLEQMRELCIHRSAYQLKEADPHTWAIPRLAGRAKAAMVEIQSDEYGDGRPEAMHASLFGLTMAELGLDPAYGRYLNRIPATTLATVNLISMLGLHRRLRGALVGHLALFEMTSVGPMSRYSRALERLGVSGEARRFYDVHVEADVRHERIALDEMVTGLLEQEPELAPDVVDGARWLTEVEARFTRHVLDCWQRGHSSLRPDTAGAGPGSGLAAWSGPVGGRSVPADLVRAQELGGRRAAVTDVT